MTLIKVVVAVFVGVLMGLLITIYSLDHTNQGVVVGAWHGAPRDGLGEVDPYALAANARASLLPLGSAEGMSLVAETDSDGADLDGRCDYSVLGPMPPARFWTLSLLTPEGFPIANPAARYAYTSSEVLRLNNGPTLVSVAADARDGNWLPTQKARRFVLMLRLYDTSLSATGSVLKAEAMPTIKKLACR